MTTPMVTQTLGGGPIIIPPAPPFLNFLIRDGSGPEFIATAVRDRDLLLMETP